MAKKPIEPYQLVLVTIPFVFALLFSHAAYAHTRLAFGGRTAQAVVRELTNAQQNNRSFADNYTYRVSSSAFNQPLYIHLEHRTTIGETVTVTALPNGAHARLGQVPNKTIVVVQDVIVAVLLAGPLWVYAKYWRAARAQRATADK